MVGAPGGGGRAVAGEKESNPGCCVEGRKLDHPRNGGMVPQRICLEISSLEVRLNLVY